jgi:transposase
MLSDAQWALLEPLVEICRPKGKTPPQDLRRTVSAILWRHQNGAKWRSIPEELGPWWRAAQIFIRWARAGVWERLLSLVQERGVLLGMVFLDGTSVRAHQKAAGARSSASACRRVAGEGGPPHSASLRPTATGAWAGPCGRPA